MTTDPEPRPEWLPTIAELDAEEQRLSDEIKHDTDPRCAVCHGIHSWFMCPIDDSAAQVLDRK